MRTWSICRPMCRRRIPIKVFAISFGDFSPGHTPIHRPSFDRFLYESAQWLFQRFSPIVEARPFAGRERIDELSKQLTSHRRV